MKPPALLRSLLALFACVALAGCFQQDVLISVKPDGSGTVTETFLMSKTAVAQMKQMASGFAGLGDEAGGDKPAKKDEFKLLDEANLKEKASKMGEGVTFVSAKPHNTATGEGYIATYAFKDITKLKIDQNPGASLPDTGGALKAESKAENLTFEFAKGSPATLTIKTPADQILDKQKEKKAEKKEKESDENEAMALMMMQQMFKDMKLSIAIEVAGKIWETNAEHVAGNRITLVEMDFNKLLANPEKFKEMAKAEPETLEEVKTILKGVDGIKMQFANPLKVKFQ